MACSPDPQPVGCLHRHARLRSGDPLSRGGQDRVAGRFEPVADHPESRLLHQGERLFIDRVHAAVAGPGDPKPTRQDRSAELADVIAVGGEGVRPDEKLPDVVACDAVRHLVGHAGDRPPAKAVSVIEGRGAERTAPGAAADRRHNQEAPPFEGEPVAVQV